VRLRDGDGSSLMASIEQMRYQLNVIAHGIKSAAETISVASGQIAQGNFDSRNAPKNRPPRWKKPPPAWKS
jgi:methyl-accepting chemotaxis protein